MEAASKMSSFCRCTQTKEELIPMLEESNITIIAAESFKNDPSSSVKYLLKVK